MPLLSILRFFGMLLSLAVLSTAVYLLWQWWQGDVTISSDGRLLRTRETWLLWLGLGLVAWSFLGRFFIPFLLAKGDNRKTRAERENGVSKSDPAMGVYVEEHGQGAPTIILIHGWSLDSTAWHYAKQDLSKRFRLITWDLPGMGRSKTAGPITLAGFSEQLRSLVVANAAAGPLVLIGHSIGGMTVQTLAKDHPELFGKEVVGVVLLNTTYTNPLKTIIMSGFMQTIQKPVLEPAMHLTKALQPIVWAMAWQSYFSGWTHVANRFGFGKYVTRSQLEHVTLLTTRNPPGNVAQGNLAMFDWDATGAFAGLPVPILVIGGKMDIVTKPEASKAISDSAPSAELLLVDGVNHMGFMERPDVYNQVIATFVARVHQGLKQG